MSSDDSDRTMYGYDSGYNPTALNYNPRLNSTPYESDRAPATRMDLAGMGMQATNESDVPSLWSGVGYPRENALRWGDFWLRYERQGFARAVIDKPAHDTWQDTPEVVDDGATDDGNETTSFEEDVERLFSGETLRRKPLHRFDVADRLAQLGEFSLLVLGFRDDRDLSEPVSEAFADGSDGQPLADDEGDLEQPFESVEDLSYVAVFGQDRVESIEVETDMSSPRFRYPISYEVVTEGESDESMKDTQVNVDPAETQDGPDTETIHWSRVIHIPEGTMESDLRGTPKLKPIWNNLLNIEKIEAGSAEGYWRGGYNGLVVRPPDGPDGTPVDFSDDSEGVREQLDAYLKNFNREISTTGHIESIDVNISDPESHINQQIKEIAACYSFPQSVLMGNETGERATTEDNAMWREKIASRRNTFADPVIVRSFLDRLVLVGVLSPPSGDSYEFEWPPLAEMDEKDEVDIINTLANALETLSNGDPERLASPAELRAMLEWDPEYGSEVDGEFDPENPERDELDDLEDEMQAALGEGAEEMDQQMGDPSTLEEQDETDQAVADD